MGLADRLLGGLLFANAVVLTAAPCVIAQERASVGVVTSLEGTATVARLELSHARLLRFKDDVYVRDRITTGDQSVVRVLLGGKATVTARERSVLTITESSGVSTIHLDDGRISVAVSKGLMKPGEVIEIKTPNAVSAIRGTVVVAEVVPGRTIRSTISVLRGLVEVIRLDAGQRVGRSVNVGVLQAVTVTGANPIPPPSVITADAARRLTSEFRILPREMPSAATAPAVELAMRQAIDDAEGAGRAHRAAEKSSGAAGARTDAGSAGRDKHDRESNNDTHDNRDGKGKDKDSVNEAVVGNVTAPSGNALQSGTAATASGSGGVNLVEAVMNLVPAKKNAKK